MTSLATPHRARRTSGPGRPVSAVAWPVPELRGTAPMDAAERLRDLPGLALLESARPGRTGRWSFLTADPVAVLEAPADGPDPFADARRLLGRLAGGRPRVPVGAAVAESGSTIPPPFAGGLVGYLGYDLGRRLERLPSLAVADQELPDLRLALHDWVLAWDRRTGETWLAGRALDGDVDRLAARLEAVHARVGGPGGARDGVPADARAEAAAPAGVGVGPARREEPASTELRSGMPRATWIDRVEAVRDAIARGEIYQANLTRRLEAPFAGDPWPLFRRLRTGDPALFAAFLDLGPAPRAGVPRAGAMRSGAPRALLSASPEPYLAVGEDGRVATDPIKGTRPRGRTRAEDRALARELLESAKDQAENVMIVDVLRNDLGRVCVPGSVRVPRLCRLERTAAVQHLVTTVTGQLRPGLDPLHLLAAAFPGGSITGAPKIRAMELIETLEPVRRGPYTGALAWIGPDGAMGSSILIRTFVADGERLTLHVGGGITWRSDPVEEWEETVAKASGPLGAIGAREVES